MIVSYLAHAEELIHGPGEIGLLESEGEGRLMAVVGDVLPQIPSISRTDIYFALDATARCISECHAQFTSVACTSPHSLADLHL